MKIGEAIELIDRLKANSYQEEDKIRWLSEIDSGLMNIVFNTHEGSVENHLPYDPSAEGVKDIVLLVPEPYSKLYVSALGYKIDYFNGEYERFNNSAAMYNTELQEFKNYWNREHKPHQLHRTNMK